MTRRRALEGALGVAATAVAVPALSGVASAHFPAELDIDIQPDNAENFIDLAAHDAVRVAVHPSTFRNGDGETTTFDPTEETVRYRFGSRYAVRDGNGARPIDDGEVVQLDSGHGESHDALVLEFPVDETGLDGGEETAWLYWERDDSGDHGYAGVDSVRVYGTDGPNRELLDLLRQVLDGGREE
ncbi:hypothetical protein KTS37_14595 [Halomicroarcula salina]|uniref:Uncharacterized protein n=1 Tax=Haloarcula salina TaxID=1429914 RepID=A0AA41G2D0_9EURY|nr:hypothetical protein [Haloarcula salina]